MALSWNEIKDRALHFSKEWEGESRERAEKDTFWNEFLHVFGITRRRVATFEAPVKKLNNHTGFIDLFWKGTLLVEHKSLGEDLTAAYYQGVDYLEGIPDHELPKYLLVSDFERFRLYDLEAEEEAHEFHLNELVNNVKLFGFIAGYQKRSFQEQDPVNIEAAELMGKLHDQLEESGYEGHFLELYLVRLLFCLFADNTTIFERDTFLEFIETRTAEDGSDLGAWLGQFFQVLNTPQEKRQKNLDESLAEFPYVNGKLFEEYVPIASFNSSMREILIRCGSLDWGKISPAIFGSMFQSVMDADERRNLGAHYTSEKNIMKLIKPLFMDELYERFEKIKSNKNRLREFHDELGKLTFLDPACGCGNFLIIAYRELRLLELEVLKALYGKQQAIGIETLLRVNVDQFYGIEYDEFPARIAEVALWLMDHQMNLVVSEAFGQYYARLPLTKSATIVNGNALQISWEDLISKEKLKVILGNPPFLGTAYQNEEQKGDIRRVFNGVKSHGMLDYVSAWYLLAAKMVKGSKIRVGFVSTNSIIQGEQTGILWNVLFNKFEVKILFAHQTFKWRNEAKGIAAVHVVIIGFASFDQRKKFLFEYDDINGEPFARRVVNINPYLVEGSDTVVLARTNPLCNVPKIGVGSAFLDGGNLILSEEERLNVIGEEPLLQNHIKPLISSYEFLNDKKRWCFWLKGVDPKVIRDSKILQERIKKVQEFRLGSKRKRTYEMANYPTLPGEERQPSHDFLLIPKVSSENRKIVPIGFMSAKSIVTDKVFVSMNAELYHFGVISSRMHMVWMKYTCGRLKSDFSYSNTIVYNNFPWPKDPSDKNIKAVERKAEMILEVRTEFPNSSLADLYDPLTMPPRLIKAHQELDKEVDKCYRSQQFQNEAGRVEYLFQLYQSLTEPLLG